MVETTGSVVEFLRSNCVGLVEGIHFLFELAPLVGIQWILYSIVFCRLLKLFVKESLLTWKRKKGAQSNLKLFLMKLTFCANFLVL